jgi:putative transposase
MNFRSTTMPQSRPGFVHFDEYEAVRIYQRSLPHWRQAGAIYFVTFRLGDSIPQAVLNEWEYEKRIWLAARGIQAGGDRDDWQRLIGRLPESQQRQFHKHFNRLFHIKLDECVGSCHLKALHCLEAVRQKLLEKDGDAYHLGDFAIMPNHVHLLVLPAPSSELEWLLKGIKGSTARECNLLLGRTGRFWQPDSYDHIVRSLEELTQYRQYIADNPNKAGIPLAADALYHADWMDDWLP